MVPNVPKETPFLGAGGRLASYWVTWLNSLVAAVNAAGSSLVLRVNGAAVAPVSGAITLQAGTNTTLTAAAGTITVNAQVTPAVWGPAGAGQTTWG